MLIVCPLPSSLLSSSRRNYWGLRAERRQALPLGAQHRTGRTFSRMSLAAGALASVGAGYFLHSWHWVFGPGALVWESAILFYYYYHFHGAMEEEPTARPPKQWCHIWEFPSLCQLLLSSFCLWSPSPRVAGDSLTLRGMILQATERSTSQGPSLLSPELEVEEEALSLQLKI